ncbi:hypothetical protein C8J56DRAFT_971225, partial [Mycena floridula]
MLLAPQDVSLTNHLAEEVYGPMLVGVFFSTVLYGMFTYHEKASKRDSIWTRGLVSCIFLCITLITAFNMVAIYQPLVQKSGYLHPELPLFPVMTGIISTSVQVLMAWRIMVVTETRLWTLIIVAIAMLSFGASIGTTITISLNPQLSDHSIVIIIWLVSSAIADLMITGVLIYSLHVRKSGYKTSLDTYVNHIIRLTAQTGTLTTIFALSDAVYFPLGLALPYLYISTILSLLNARDSWTNSGNALLPASSNDVYSQSGLNFWGSMGLQNLAHTDIEMQSESNGEMGVQR